jgi:hypothetical protein
MQQPTTTALILRRNPHLVWSRGDFEVFRSLGWSNEEILRYKLRHAAILAFSASEWKTLEEEFKKYGATPNMITEEREAVRNVWKSSSSIWHPYSEEIAQLEEKFNEKRKLIEEEWRRVLKQKYELLPDPPLEQFSKSVAMFKERTIRSLFENRVLDANISQFQAETKLEALLKQDPELNKHFDQFLKRARERIKTTIGIDIEAKDFTIEKLESHLRKDMQEILQRTGALSILRQLHLARRKADYYIIRKTMPLSMKKWLTRHVSTGIVNKLQNL